MIHAAGSTTPARRLTGAQKTVLACAFLPMLGTGIAGGVGTFSNISQTYGEGTALGAVAAGEGATAVLALVLLGLTMLGQSSPWPVRLGLWALPAAASVMAAMAGPDPARTVIYAVTPMGMCVSAEGMAFLARRIVVHADGRDAEAERKAAAIIQSLAYHRARAAHHPDEKVRKWSERKSWRLAREVGTGDAALGGRLLDIQRERVTHGADAALVEMFSVAVTPVALEPPKKPERLKDTEGPKPPRKRTAKAKGKASKAPRTRAELLAQAREATAEWPDDAINAEAIRTTLHCSAANSRVLRDALLTERAEGRSLHPVEGTEGAAA